MIVNPDGVRNQIEGGLIQSTSWTLKEQVRFEDGRIASRDWAGYPILRFSDVPEIEIALIDRPDDPPLGAGEIAQGPMAAAIANAVHAAIGVRIRDLPLTRDRIIAAT
jgi:nicotinate dehydrogenase subunit B